VVFEVEVVTPVVGLVVVVVVPGFTVLVLPHVKTAGLKRTCKRGSVQNRNVNIPRNGVASVGGVNVEKDTRVILENASSITIKKHEG